MSRTARELLKDSPRDRMHPSREEVREALHLLLGRKDFIASDRNRRFLSYVVDETLEGRADRIKAYSVAIAAFGRADDFDPLTDPIVRIEAGRLRRSLEHYYLTAGKADPIRIDIPKGSYVATFKYANSTGPDEQSKPPSNDGVPPPLEPPTSKSEQAPSVAKRRWSLTTWAFLVALSTLAVILAASTMWWYDHDPNITLPDRGPSILVLPFENVGANSTHDFVARGLTFEVINSLTRFSDLLVFVPETSFAIGQQQPGTFSSRTIDADYILFGSVHSTKGVLRVSAILSDARTSQSVWSADFDRRLATDKSIQGGIAEQVASAVRRRIQPDRR